MKYTSSALCVISIFCWTLSLCQLVSAQKPRIWTDVDGRKIEATMLGLKNDSVRVLLKGKEIQIPMNRLSEEDRHYAQDWKPGDEEPEEDVEDEEPEADAPKDPDKKPADVRLPAGKATFDGKELITGGKSNFYEYDYSEEYIKDIKKKFKAEDTGYRIAISVPADFDPSKPQKVFVACGAANNAKQAADGNIGAQRFYAGWAVSRGWVCIGYGSNIGLAATHDGGYLQSIDKLKEVWPGFAGWTIVTGGNSGGAKGALRDACTLKHKGVPVRGVFVAGCNDAGNLAWGRDAYKLSKGDIKEMRFYLSSSRTGYGQATIDGMIASIKGEGGSVIRSELFDDNFDNRKAQLHIALDWFAQAAP